MSQYPMYPTQLSYLPTAPMYGYPANYPYMLPAAMYPGTQGTPAQSQASMVQAQQQQQTQIQTQVSQESVDTSKEAGPRQEMVTVTSSVGEESEDRSEYIDELTREKEALGETGNSHAKRLIDREISLAQSGAASLPSSCETQMVDVYREKPIRLVVKVTVPVKEHPKFNFVGKLLGPKGNSLKRLQEETLTKMAVLGKGSMRDKAKEEEMRLGKDPKYHHLNGELHVEIVAFAPPAEAHARMSYALTEVRKYLIPDSNDTIRQLQMKELEILNSSEKMLTDPGMQLLKTVGPVGGMPSMPSMQPLLVPSTSYLPSPHLSLLPTPPLDSAPGGAAPTIQAPPTKYDTELEAGEGGVTQGAGAGHISRHVSLKMSETKRGERRREAQPY